MYHQFDESVRWMESYLADNNYSVPVTCMHIQCFRLLKKHLVANAVEYTWEIVYTWLNDNEVSWGHSKFKAFRIAAYRLDDVIRNGKITQDSYIYDISPMYDRLPGWTKALLDEHLNSLQRKYKDSSIQQFRISCSDFLAFSLNTEEPNYELFNLSLIRDYHARHTHSTNESQNQYERNIRRFLKYMSGKGLIPFSIALSMDKFVLPYTFLIDELPDEEKNRFLTAAMVSKDDDIVPFEYLESIQTLTGIYLPKHRYSRTSKKTFKKAWMLFYIFIEMNKLNYSSSLAEVWLDFNKTMLKTQWKEYRRAFKLLEQYFAEGDINPGERYTYKPNSSEILPVWCKTALNDYLSLRKREGFASSTIAMAKSSCMRFLKYLADCGVKSFSEITPTLINSFNLNDDHLTAEGKSAYNVRIRQFLDFLADNGEVSNTLRFALPCQTAPKTVIVETLTNEQIHDIYEYKINAEDPMALRNAAIVMIGLRMGLRSIDIVNIKLTDIDWKNQKITLIQQKTNVWISLPMPIEVGNCVYRYIMNGRPVTESPFLFISHRVPYGQLVRVACERALKSILANKSPVKGFHVTRKSFATNLLKSGSTVDMVVDSLGQRGKSTVHKYLSLDDENMRRCSISLADAGLNKAVD